MTVPVPSVFSLRLPLQTVSLTNVRSHWAAKARRAKAERVCVAWLWRGRKLAAGEEARVVMCRVAPRALDSDNLTSALKACRDQLAAELGLDDRDPRVTWLYEQRKGKPREHAVEVEVRYSLAETR